MPLLKKIVPITTPILLAVMIVGCSIGTRKPEPLAVTISRELATTNETGVVTSDPDAAYEEMELLVEAIMAVKQGYVKEIPFRDLLYGAINGMLFSLDPHSAFLKPKNFSALREDAHGSFFGVGMTIGIDRGGLVVIAPIEDSPAFRQGVLAGDRITAIEGEPTDNISVDTAVTRLRGDRGTSVRVTFRRDSGDPFDITIERDEIRITSVKGAQLIQDGIGYIRITQFGENTPAEFATALQQLRQQNLRALILDLRSDPGGLLESAVEIAQHFLPPKAVVVTVRGREGHSRERVYHAFGHHHDTTTPLAILINRGSASAAEILAGAMQDHQRAVLVGETSFGKASVQNVTPMQTRPECGIKLTTAFYYTPTNRLIHGKGITPCHVIPMKPEEWRKAQLKRMYDELPGAFPVDKREPVADATDPQLEKAFELLQTALAPKKPPVAEPLLQTGTTTNQPPATDTPPPPDTADPANEPPTVNDP